MAPKAKTKVGERMDYKHVTEDMRRGIVNNNIQQVEQEHASTALALEMAEKMIQKAGEDESLVMSYKVQRDELSTRLRSLTSQLAAWNEILETIPKLSLVNDSAS